MNLLLWVLLAGCADVTPDDRPPPGGDPVDGGTTDAGAADGGTDGGSGSDAGSTTDGGTADGGTDGGGITDGGTDGGSTEPGPAIQFTGDAPTNVLIISVDTTRRDQVGWYSGLDTTPNLDAIFGAGLVLQEHRSCSNWTAPSMLCAMNGRWPLADDFWPTGVFDESADPLVPVAPAGLPSLASLLKAHGFATGFVTANSVISPYNSIHFVEGFDLVENTYGADGPTTAPIALSMLDQLQVSGDPWLLHVHFLDPHGPYAAPDRYNTELDDIDPGYEFPFDVTDSGEVYELFSYWPWLTEAEELVAREYLFAVYRAELRYWDNTLAELWEELTTRGDLDDTLVVFYSDHGEQFGEHDRFQHGKTLHPEENRAIGAFWAKDIVPGMWAGPTQRQDLAPSILDALGVAATDAHEGSVVGLAEPDRPRFSFCYLLGYCDPVMSLIQGDMQLIYRWDGKRFMYDLALDPEATDDLYEDGDLRAHALWTVLQPQVQGVVDRWPHLEAVDADP